MGRRCQHLEERGSGRVVRALRGTRTHKVTPNSWMPSATGSVPANAAVAYSLAGNRDKAFENLEKAYDRSRRRNHRRNPLPSLRHSEVRPSLARATPQTQPPAIASFLSARRPERSEGSLFVFLVAGTAFTLCSFFSGDSAHRMTAIGWPTEKRHHVRHRLDRIAGSLRWRPVFVVYTIVFRVEKAIYFRDNLQHLRRISLIRGLLAQFFPTFAGLTLHQNTPPLGLPSISQMTSAHSSDCLATTPFSRD